MKTLKQLVNNCVLVAQFNQPSFIVIEGYPANLYKRANKAYIFYDNNGTYYLYTHIINATIHEYYSMNDALDHFLTFIELVTKVN